MDQNITRTLPSMEFKQKNLHLKNFCLISSQAKKWLDKNLNIAKTSYAALLYKTNEPLYKKNMTWEWFHATFVLCTDAQIMTFYSHIKAK